MKSTATLAALAFAALGAQADVLDFGVAGNPSICSATPDGLGSSVTCSNYSYLNQSYGDVAGVVDVSYSSVGFAPNSLHWWADDYNDLHGVAWADGGDGPASHARIELKPLAGGAVTLTHFDLGAYSQTTRGTNVAIYEIGGGSPLFTFSGNVGSGLTHTSFDVNISSAKGLWLEWENTAYNVGIDNVTYTVGAVPEPGTYALMLGGLAILGMVGRARRR